MAIFSENDTSSTIQSSTAIITTGMKVTGNLEGSTTIHIDGHVTGNITAISSIIVGKDGIIDGDIKAKDILIKGKVKGNIVASEILEIGKDGSADGDISISRIKIYEGGKILGLVSLYKEKVKKLQPVQSEQKIVPEVKKVLK